MFVHLASYEISCRSIVTSVQLGEPLAIFELGDATTHFVSVGPHHGGVMSDVSAEPN